MKNNPSEQDPAIVLDDGDDPVADHSLGGILFSLILLFIGSVFLWQSLNNSSPAGVWPRILAVFLVGLAGIQTLKGLISRRGAGLTSTSIPTFNRPVVARRVFTALWLLAYCGVAQLVGFGAAAVVFVPVYMVVMGYRKPVAIVLTTLLFLGALTLMFDTVANVPVWSARL